MSSRIDNRLSRLVESLRSRLFNPFIDPEDAMRIEYMLRDHEARMESIRASKFRNTIKGVAKGEPTRAIIKTTSIPTEYPRNVQAERMAHEIAVASHKLPQYNASLLPAVIRKPVNFFPFRKYDFVGKDRTLYDTNWAYNESGVPPEWSMNLPVTEEQAREFRRIDERRNKAESLRRQRRLKRGREEQAAREAFSYDMMDEFDQKMADLTKRYGGDTGKADISMRNLLKKELPPFFKNSRMSTKDLHRTAEFFRSAKKIPFVGHAIGLSANPIAASVGFALSALTTSMENSRKIVDWTLKESVTGAPSSKMELAMKKAGIGDQGAVLQKYGAITSWLADLETNPEAWSVLGDVALASMGKVSLAGITSKSTPEDVAKLIAPQLGALSFNERLRTVRALGRIGVDENVINAFETYAGVKTTTADQDIVGGVQQRIDTARRMFAEHPFLNADQLVYLIPYLGRLVATLDEQTLKLFGASYSSESVVGDGFNISDAIKATNAAAAVDSQASEIISRGNGASGGSTNIKGDTHITIEVGTIETDSPQDFIKQMKALGSQYFQEVGEAFDQKAR